MSVGPCFGFCPVYEVAITHHPKGAVNFNRSRHTAVLGERRPRARPGSYRAVADGLAPFRPAEGTTAQVECDALVSDAPSYQITWTSADGRATVATHRGGCPAGVGQALDKVLDRLIWEKQSR